MGAGAALEGASDLRLQPALLRARAYFFTRGKHGVMLSGATVGSPCVRERFRQVPWVRLDDQFAEHPKIIGLSDGAFRTHVAALCYCNRNLTDGHVPAALGSSHAAELLEAGIWELNGNGYDVHDYADYQPTGEETERIRELRREAGRKGGLASAQARRQANEAKPKQVAQQTPSKTEAKSNPVPVPEPSLEANASVRTVYDCWREERKRTDSRYAKLSDGRRKKIQARLKEFSVEELCNAIRCVARDPWPERANNDDLTVIFRSREQVERFLGFTPNGASAKPHACHCGQSFLRPERLAEHQSDVHGA